MKPKSYCDIGHSCCEFLLWAIDKKGVIYTDDEHELHSDWLSDDDWENIIASGRIDLDDNIGSIAQEDTTRELERAINIIVREYPEIKWWVCEDDVPKSVQEYYEQVEGANMTSTVVVVGKHALWEAVSSNPITDEQAKKSQECDGYDISVYGFKSFVYYGKNQQGWHIARWESLA